MKTNNCFFFPTLGQRRPQTNLLGQLIFSNECLTSYDVMSASLTLSVQLAIIKKSYLYDKENNRPFVSDFTTLGSTR